ncbi:hypothetical protein [Scytonema sp. PRP1]
METSAAMPAARTRVQPWEEHNAAVLTAVTINPVERCINRTLFLLN